MQNPATRPRSELNEFTKLVKDSDGSAKVKLRNGTIVVPIFFPVEDELCRDTFITKDVDYCWNMDGTSVTRHDYDMMEIVNN